MTVAIDRKGKGIQPGDVIFVAAGVDHRFEEFTPDFAAWVIFIDTDPPEDID